MISENSIIELDNICIVSTNRRHRYPSMEQIDMSNSFVSQSCLNGRIFVTLAVPYRHVTWYVGGLSIDRRLAPCRLVSVLTVEIWCVNLSLDPSCTRCVVTYQVHGYTCDYRLNWLRWIRKVICVGSRLDFIRHMTEAMSYFSYEKIRSRPKRRLIPASVQVRPKSLPYPPIYFCGYIQDFNVSTEEIIRKFEYYMKFNVFIMLNLDLRLSNDSPRVWHQRVLLLKMWFLKWSLLNINHISYRLDLANCIGA